MGKPRPNELVELDGRTLEGGGQLIRVALCLSALTGTPVKITDIRGARSGGGGLKAQHLACVNWLAHACNAKVEGAEKGSKTLVFEPGEVDGLPPAFKKKTLPDGSQVYECRLDIGTAGSTGLALQAILPFILFSRLPSELPVRLTLSGGTNVSGSPSYEYITQVLLPQLHGIGFPEIKAKLGKRGWSHGGTSIGNFTLEIPPRADVGLPAFHLRPENPTSSKPEKPTHLHATFIAPASCHDHFRTVLLPAIHHHFGETYSREASPPTLTITCEGSLHEKRMYLVIVATLPSSKNPAVHPPTHHRLGRDWLYDRKIRSHERAATEMAERVTNELAEEVESGGWVDEHMRDQLVIFQALAAGRSEVFAGRDEDGEAREASLHARTAEWVAKEMVGVRFDVESECEGVGFGGDGALRALQEEGQVMGDEVQGLKPWRKFIVEALSTLRTPPSPLARNGIVSSAHKQNIVHLSNPLHLHTVSTMSAWRSPTALLQLANLAALGGMTAYFKNHHDYNLQEHEARMDELEGTLRGHIGLIEEALERLEGKKMDGKSQKTEELYTARGKDEKKK